MTCVFICMMQENNSTNTTGDAEVKNTAAFPYDLYSQASKASVSHPQLLSKCKIEEAKDMTWFVYL